MSLETSYLIDGSMAINTKNMTNDGFPPSKATEDVKSSTGSESLSPLHSGYMRTSLPKQLLVCAFLSIFGWYAPDRLIRPVTGMTMKEIPYQVLNSGEIVLDQSLNYPVVENVTISSNILVHSTVAFPLFLLASIAFIRPRVQQRYHDVHSGFCMILLCIGMTQFLTGMPKIYVGRLRPNFYALCDFGTTTLTCMAEEADILQARSSFPSGHSSLSFGSMGCLVWFFLGRSTIGAVASKRNYGEEIDANHPLNHKRSTDNKLRAVASFLPWVYASFVACSRLVDNWHHPSDILAGSLLGIFCSTLSYHLWYPNIFSPNAGVPFSWLFRNIGGESIHLKTESDFQLLTPC